MLVFVLVASNHKIFRDLSLLLVIALQCVAAIVFLFFLY